MLALQTAHPSQDAWRFFASMLACFVTVLVPALRRLTVKAVGTYDESLLPVAQDMEMEHFDWRPLKKRETGIDQEIDGVRLCATARLHITRRNIIPGSMRVLVCGSGVFATSCFSNTGSEGVPFFGV